VSGQVAPIGAPIHRRRKLRDPIGIRAEAISILDGIGLIVEPRTRKMVPTGNHS
jgi:hypothetical protein